MKHEKQEVRLTRRSTSPCAYSCSARTCAGERDGADAPGNKTRCVSSSFGESTAVGDTPAGDRIAVDDGKHALSERETHVVRRRVNAGGGAALVARVRDTT
jgi:hypothetical protein